MVTCLPAIEVACHRKLELCSILSVSLRGAPQLERCGGIEQKNFVNRRRLLDMAFFLTWSLSSVIRRRPQLASNMSGEIPGGSLDVSTAGGAL